MQQNTINLFIPIKSKEIETLLELSKSNYPAIHHYNWSYRHIPRISVFDRPYIIINDKKSSNNTLFKDSS